MNFTNAQSVESVVWQMRLADWPRAKNRAKINNLANGAPPYDATEVAAGMIAVNYNDLSMSNILHNARRQFGNAFLAPDPLFTVELDSGPVYSRRDWAMAIQSEVASIVGKSLPYLETRRSQFALDAVHGIGPASWPDSYLWCPQADGVEDILVPSNTLLSLTNLPFLARYRQYTGRELWEMTHKPQVDPGWNVKLAEKVVRWVDAQAKQLMSSNWPEVWSPEKMEERIKQDGGLYSSDAIPTVDCFEFLYWNDDGKHSGWRKKIILDAWGEPGVGGVGGISLSERPVKQQGKYGQWNYDKSDFLYDSEKRRNPVFCDKLSETIHFQFADCSCVAPFRYHSVRSLGFLLYSICHVQNRLNCKFDESTFESLLQYFRVTNAADAERAWKIDLADKKALPDGLQFVKRDERWQIDGNLVKMALDKNRQIMSDNSASFAQDFDFESGENETATRTMAKVNTSAALVSGMLTQAYAYQKFQYQEICRRFCIANSRDPDVRRFRLNVLKQGVPEGMLNVERWDIQPVKVMGSGNKMLQNAIFDKIMLFYYNKLEPTAQRHILRLSLASLTDDYELARSLVPEQPVVSDSIHDAQLAAGVMLQGLPMALKEGVNQSEYIEALLGSMNAKVQQINSRGGVGTMDEIAGLQNLAGETIQGQPIPGNGIANHLRLFAEDKKEPHVKGVPPDHSVAQKVKLYGDALGKLMNAVKAFAQRAAEQAQKQNGANGGVDPQTMAKLKSTMMMAQVKAANARESHAQRTAMRQLQFEQELRQKGQEHLQDLAINDQKSKLEMAHNRLKDFFGYGNDDTSKNGRGAKPENGE
jgi:hypothetical protein